MQKIVTLAAMSLMIVSISVSKPRAQEDKENVEMVAIMAKLAGMCGAIRLGLGDRRKDLFSVKKG